MGLWACGPVGLLGPVGLWACGPVGLWACGPVGLWACGHVSLWAFGPTMGLRAAFLHPTNSSTLYVLFDYNVIRKECLSKNVISNISIGSIVIVEIRYLLIAKVSKKE